MLYLKLAVASVLVWALAARLVGCRRESVARGIEDAMLRHGASYQQAQHAGDSVRHGRRPWPT